MTDINLGDEAKDSITGFTGVVVAKTSWIHGCDRIVLQPKVGKDGKFPENATFDVSALILVKAKAVKKDERKVKTGGSQNDKAALRR